MAAVIAAGCASVENAAAQEYSEISDGMYVWFLVQAYDDACSLNGGKKDLWGKRDRRAKHAGMDRRQGKDIRQRISRGGKEVRRRGNGTDARRGGSDRQHSGKILE